MGSVRTSHPGGRGPCSSASCGGVVGADMCCDRRSEDINCTCSCACLDQSYPKQRPSPRRRLAGEERCRHRNVEVRGKGKGCRPHLMGPMYSTLPVPLRRTLIWRHCPQTRNNHSLLVHNYCCSLLRQIHHKYENLQHVCISDNTRSQRNYVSTTRLSLKPQSSTDQHQRYYVSSTQRVRPSRGNNSSRAPVT